MQSRQSDSPPLNQATLGTRIAAARKGKALTVTDVARKLEVRIQTVSDWEADKNLPRLEIAARLGRLLDMTSEEILQVAEGHEPPFDAWREWVDGRTDVSAQELRALKAIMWPEGMEPTRAAYDLQLAALRLAKPRVR